MWPDVFLIDVEPSRDGDEADPMNHAFSWKIFLVVLSPRKAKKLPGMDGVTHEIICGLAYTLLRHVHGHFNAICRETPFPQASLKPSSTLSIRLVVRVFFQFSRHRPSANSSRN